MWQAVALFMCLLLCAAIAAAAFVYGRQIGYTKRDNELLLKHHDEMAKKIEDDAVLLQQMNVILEEKEIQRAQQMADKQRQTESDGWDAFRSRQ